MIPLITHVNKSVYSITFTFVVEVTWTGYSRFHAERREMPHSWCPALLQLPGCHLTAVPAFDNATTAQISGQPPCCSALDGAGCE